MFIDRNGILSFSNRESRILAINGPEAHKLRKKARRLMDNYTDRQSRRAHRNPTRDPANVHSLSHRPEVPLSVP